MANMVERYRRWYEYEKDSHAKALESLRGISPSSQASPAFQKAVDLMAHLVAARRLWLFRMGKAKEGPADLFPQGTKLEVISRQVEGMHAEWSAYFNAMTEDELGREFDYQSHEGPWFRNRVEDILTQLVGHSWYHRGQVAALVRSLGAEPAVSDFVFWTRQEIAAPRKQ